MDSTLLQAKCLSFAYGNKTLFKNISLNLNEGELILVTGKNGSGKTTLLKILAGLLECNQGSVEITSDLAHPVISYLAAETNGHFLKLNAEDNLNFWSALLGSDLSDAKIRDILIKWSLDHVLSHPNFPVQKYSTGMKRKLALARFSFLQSRIWILDEPVLGLDKSSKEIFVEMIHEHLAAKNAVVIVNHDEGLLRQTTSNHVEIADFA